MQMIENLSEGDREKEPVGRRQRCGDGGDMRWRRRAVGAEESEGEERRRARRSVAGVRGREERRQRRPAAARVRAG